MLESSAFRYCLYGSCAIICSELVYYSCVWLKAQLDKQASSEEVQEVIWTNELTQTCAAKHRFINKQSSSGINTSLKKSAQAGKVPLNVRCDNPYCSTKHIGRVIEYIDATKYSIDLAMYTFTSFELSEAFIRALQRGVLIRIISDREMAYSTGSQIISLTKKGVPVRCNSSTAFMHHKFCILDNPRRVAEIRKKQNRLTEKGQSKSILLTGSLNWTNQGFGGNFENILVTNNKKYINKYFEEFERMWHAFDVDLKGDDK